MTSRRWELDDPADVLRQVNAICPFRSGETVVAAVRLADQVVTGARVATRKPEEGRDDSDLARKMAEELVPERWSVVKDGSGISHLLVTVVCREGRVIPSRKEYDWMRAWRYSNHFRGAFHGDVFVVTPHGWTGVLDERAGYEPSLADNGPA